MDIRLKPKKRQGVTWLLPENLELHLDQMKNYNSKREDLEEEDQRQDERNVIL
jgi:hypothetical protein